MPDLTKYLPKYYQTSQIMLNITGAESTEIEIFKTKLALVMNQFIVDTATYALEDWEKELGIPVDNSKPAEYRRSVIKSKMRGSGTITIMLLKNVAESYVNGSVEVAEDNANYKFTVTFVDDRGIPPNLTDLQAAIESIKPAHLGVEYVFTYNTYQYVSQFTHAQLAAFTHDQIRNEELS